MVGTDAAITRRDLLRRGRRCATRFAASAALGLGAATVVGGCSGRPAPRSDGASTGGPAASASASGTPPVSAVVAALDQALRRRDRAAFLAAFVPTLASTAAVVYDNATRLGSFTLDADAGGVRAHTRVGSEPDADSTDLAVSLDAADRVSGLRAADPRARPVWLQYPLEVIGGEAAGIAGSRAHAAALPPWAQAADEAAHHLRRTALGPWADAWDGHLALEVPHDLLGFAAEEWVWGYVTDAAVPAASRIVLNPLRLGDPEASARVELLVHEGVHVATRSTRSSAPLWAVEGFAEHVATGAGHDLARENARLVAEQLASGPPGGLPTRGDLGAPDQAAAQRAYALAQVAVEAAFARWGREPTLAWFSAWDQPGRPPEEEFRRAYLTTLERRRRGR